MPSKDPKSESIMKEGKKKKGRKYKETEEDILQAEADAREAEKLQRRLFGRQTEAAALDFGKELEDEDDDEPLVRPEHSGSQSEDSDAGPSETESEQPSAVDTRVEPPGKQKRKPAWVDLQDEIVKVNLTSASRLRKLRKEDGENAVEGRDYVARLRMQHQKLNPGTEWAKLSAKKKKSASENDAQAGSVIDDDDDNPMDILARADELVVKDRTRLQPGELEVTRMQDANQEEYSSSAVQSVQFHPNGQLLMTAGLDKSLRFFHIDGKRNSKVQGLFLADMPVHKAQFAGAGGRNIIAAGRRKWFYVVDLETARVDRVNGIVGRDDSSLESFEVAPPSASGVSDVVAFLGNNGGILLVSQRTRQLVGTLQLNGSVRSAAFSPDGRELLAAGGDGEIYTWDVGTRRCIHRARDDGCLTSTGLAVSADSQLFAAASDTGVVNLYKRQSFLSGQYEPAKVLMNLTTGVDTMAFNHDTQLLAISSKLKRDAMRLVHLPSFTVFSNWPTSRSPLHYVHSLDFSPNSGYLAIGNARGKVLLYRLHHYDKV